MSNFYNTVKKAGTALLAVALLAGCGSKDNTPSGGGSSDVDPADLTFPLAETATISGLTNYPAGTESNPNNRTIFKRLEEQTNVHVEWKAIQSDQWGDKIALEMSNVKTLPEFVFSAGFGDTDLLKYAKQGAIIHLEEYIDQYMPNLKAVFEKAPEYRTMCEDADGHIWALPWIEQLGYEKTAIQVLDNMSFINKNWLDFLGLPVPSTVDEFEQTLLAFKDNADKLKAEFNIDGDIIPMSCIMNDGGQDPMILINGFGEGLGDPDPGRHIVVTDEGKVVCGATQEGFKKGLEWLHKLYAEGLIDVEAFTQDWSTYVAKGKSGRYGVCFTWDVANVAQVSMDDLIAGKSWVPMPVLEADTKNLTADNGSFTSGFDRGRCVVTATAKNPALVCAWLDQMYIPIQSPQNNWGTYGEDDDFDIFEMSENANGEPMLKHTWLGDASPVEVREAEAVGGPLAILDEYYDVYVTCPDDAQYRLDWIKDIYTPDIHEKYVFPNVFMTTDDTKRCSDLQADLNKTINEFKSNAVKDGFDDAAWDKLQSDLEAYGLSEYLEIHQKYFDAFNK
ncbi:MAG: extracellular solute-binding protein [Solobacterium sp.]|nr:extracellular solute-binding protein [Solobacterium sp.]